MAMTVKRRKDNESPRVLIHKVADIRGGVSVATSELGGNYFPEGTILSKPDKGICHAIKTVVVSKSVGANDTSIEVKKAHLFKVGDVVMAKAGDKASKITAIDTTGKDSDKLTLSAAIGELTPGTFLAEAKAASTSNTSALKYEPFSLAGTGKPFGPKENIDNDAWLIAVTTNYELPDFIASKLKGIINY